MGRSIACWRGASAGSCTSSGNPQRAGGARVNSIRVRRDAGFGNIPANPPTCSQIGQPATNSNTLPTTPPAMRPLPPSDHFCVEVKQASSEDSPGCNAHTAKLGPSRQKGHAPESKHKWDSPASGAVRTRQQYAQIRRLAHFRVDELALNRRVNYVVQHRIKLPRARIRCTTRISGQIRTVKQVPESLVYRGRQRRRQPGTRILGQRRNHRRHYKHLRQRLQTLNILAN